ncbi:two-component sensor histidine kinase [Thauera propionica]|uniref:histidine kinase n=1 Tax=Thauera propionica TaxID=2019431 RepID=A0A235ETX4_9RHOO|nr:ATP-binding protein [Thauera propionica]OYD52464.1 two-component sensor histidine kinase [Thauera propionica]
MRMLWPRSLFSRLMLIWLVGIAIVLAVSFTLFVGERERVGRAALFEGVAQEIAATADVLDRLSPAERERWIDELGRRRLRLSLRPIPEHLRPAPDGHPLGSALRTAMPERETRIHLHHRNGAPHAALIVSVTLADGQPLLIRLPGIPPTPSIRPPEPGRLLAALTALIGGVGLLTWIAVRLATRPLSRMADAARALGEDPNSPPLPTRGPTEVVRAADAFNQMQKRIREHVSERTRILAAISHDLQTPITRLRLRAELVDDEALRARIQADLDSMQVLVKEGLAYARSLDDAAPAQAIDLDRLLEALRDDAEDMGWQVSLNGHAGAPLHAQPGAVRRALWNLIENGVKFGNAVAITVTPESDAFEICIRDHGPGLPEDELEKVFEPFYRVETSRNRETGGTGLGLAITRNLLRRQRGEVSLQNHPDGGLLATVRLPRTLASAA